MDPSIVVLLRYGLTTLFTFAVAKGWLTSDQAPALVNGLISLAGVAMPPLMAIWGIIDRKKALDTVPPNAGAP